MATSYKLQRDASGLSGENGAYVEGLYEDFITNPSTVSDKWRSYFERIKPQSSEEKTRLDVAEKFALLAQLPTVSSGGDNPKQLAVYRLIDNYRKRGHWHTEIDPVGIRARRDTPELSLAYYNLNDGDLDTAFDVAGAFGQDSMTLRELLAKLTATYSTHLGIEIAHLWEQEEVDWLIKMLESTANEYCTTAEDKKYILHQLVAADGMEKYLHKRYVGQKRFSLEGGDALIPLINRMIDQLARAGAEEICIGMAHRGRLNMLINVLGKRPQVLFDEFDGKLSAVPNRNGDVKYHMGFSSQLEVAGKPVNVSLMYNPSHLEFVNAVTLGSVRARLERQRRQLGRDATILDVANKAVPIMIHGDAALAAQGVNQEVLQLSQVRGFQVGGAIHVVVNNQIGFTTSNLLDTRSSMYCTDIAKSVQAPILRVNGDDPEAVVFAGKVATDYLLKFRKDIFIDIVCYRRLGHNEADEPSITQPIMYKKIHAHDVPAKIYAQKLEQTGVIDKGAYDGYVEDYRQQLEGGDSVTTTHTVKNNAADADAWKALAIQDWHEPVDTAIAPDTLKMLGEKIFTVPESFTPHTLLSRILTARLKMVAGEQAFDWGAAENLAYASLLNQGYQVRVVGEDCGRGTFSHRHAVWHDQTTGESYISLQHIKDDQPSVQIIDSILSETGVLGFEYGYSIAELNGLTVWEAQFGDFANVAQVITDQFITSGETKWGQYSGLVMLLPHGYEGQGPEHSSARLERYLQLCAKDNIQVCVPSTPAQIFHVLRRQVLRKFRKPLIVISPKSLLRHKLAVSTLDELVNGQFQEIIGEVDMQEKAKVKRIILCAGKVYYDLLQKRRDEKLDDIAIIRVEQLYPFPTELLREWLAQYPKTAEFVWCQEEPRNQGAWRQIYEDLRRVVPENTPIYYIGREESASTASGYAKVHQAEQQALVEQALDLA